MICDPDRNKPPRQLNPNVPIRCVRSSSGFAARREEVKGARIGRRGGKQECSAELLRTAGEPDSSSEQPRLSLSAGGEPSDSSQG